MDDVQKMAELFKKNEISREDFKEFLQSTNDTGRTHPEKPGTYRLTYPELQTGIRGPGFGTTTCI